MEINSNGGLIMYERQDIEKESYFRQVNAVLLPAEELLHFVIPFKPQDANRKSKSFIERQNYVESLNFKDIMFEMPVKNSLINLINLTKDLEPAEKKRLDILMKRQVEYLNYMHVIIRYDRLCYLDYTTFKWNLMELLESLEALSFRDTSEKFFVDRGNSVMISKLEGEENKDCVEWRLIRFMIALQTLGKDIDAAIVCNFISEQIKMRIRR